MSDSNTQSGQSEAGVIHRLPDLIESEERRRGELLASVLKLRKRGDCYQTQWGTKTALGLFRTVSRIVQDGE